MKLTYKLLLGFISISSSIYAQEKLKISIEQAQSIGLENRYDIKAKKYDLQIANQKLIESKQNYIPKVNLSGNIHYSPQVQSTIIPAGFGGITEPTMVSLGAKSMSIFSLELSQPIYNPLIKSDVKLAESNIDIENQRLSLQETEIRKQISYSYLNVLLRQLQLKIAKEEENRYENYSKLAKGKYENGALIENDFLRATLDYENAQQQTRISKQNYEQSLVTLKYQLNIPNDTDLELTDKLGVINDQMIVTPDFQAAKNRKEYKLLKLSEEHNTLLEKKQKRSILPTLTLVANYSQQFLNTDFNYNYSNGKWWSPYSGIGLQLNLPLTRQFTNKTSLKQIRLAGQQLKDKELQQLNDARYEIEHGAAEITNATLNYSKAENNYKLARQIYLNQSKQMELGSFSYEAILNTENSVNSAEKNFIQASYNYIIAVLNYDIATGKL